MAPRVWLAGEEDVDAVGSLLIGFRGWMGRVEPPDEVIRGTVARLIADPAAEFLLAGAERAVGVCQLRYRPCVWTGTDDCWLEDLYVDEGARGEGLGRALIDVAFERARARGCARIQLDVAEDNAPAIALYGSVGFGTAPGAAGRTMLITRRLAD